VYISCNVLATSCQCSAVLCLSLFVVAQYSLNVEKTAVCSLLRLVVAELDKIQMLLELAVLNSSLATA